MMRRIACEIPGVRVPNETHFFRVFSQTLASAAFPLAGDDLRAAISAYASLELPSRIFDIDADRILDDTNGRCASPLELFDALIRHLAGPALVYGEKTPDHIIWWRALTTARPSMKLVCMIRDPRAVAASHAGQSWGGEPRLVAERWVVDARQIATAERALGPDRCLVLRYEDVVVDPDAARGLLQSLVGIDPSSVTDEALRRFPSELFPPGERTIEAITPRTVETWREGLDPRHAALVAARCRKEMRRFGYRDEIPNGAAAAIEIARAGPRAFLGGRKAERRRRDRMRFAERFDLQSGNPSRNGQPFANR
jgi:Sulfotransferase family